MTPFAKLSVDWEKTKVWSEGGYYARVFFNVKGREPRGMIDPADYEKFRDEIKAKFEATTDELGHPLGTLVFKPEEIYHTVRNVAPDLIVHFGGLYWRSIGGVGYPDPASSRKRHRSGRLQSRPVRQFHPGSSEPPVAGRAPGSPAARHRADAAGAGWLRCTFDDAGPFPNRRAISDGGGRACPVSDGRGGYPRAAQWSRLYLMTTPKKTKYAK